MKHWDVLLVLGTRSFFKWPWCLLEIAHATKYKVPIIMVNVKNVGFDAESDGGFDASAALQYIQNLEETLGTDSPEAIGMLHEHLGPDLTSLKVACTTALESFAQAGDKQLCEAWQIHLLHA